MRSWRVVLGSEPLPGVHYLGASTYEAAVQAALDEASVEVVLDEASSTGGRVYLVGEELVAWAFEADRVDEVCVVVCSPAGAEAALQARQPSRAPVTWRGIERMEQAWRGGATQVVPLGRHWMLHSAGCFPGQVT